MHRVQTNAELEALHASGAGFVFNHFTSGPAGARDNVLHTAGCPHIRRMLDGADPLARPSVRKMHFTTLNEAQSWLASTLAPEGYGWKRCTGCQPGHAVVGNAPRPPAGMSEADDGAAAISLASPGSRPVTAVFAMPASQPLRLPVPPRLASWNKAGDADQVRLAKYLDAADELLRPHCARLPGPLALRLDIGLPQAAGLLDQRDLDNYLLPLAARLSRSTPATLTCVWGTKQHSANSFVRIEQAVPAPAAPSFDRCYTVRTDASSQSEEFKEQIRDQLATARPLPPGPVRMQISFTVGPTRNWLNLWKPVIDALGQILGHTPSARPWSPLDGRVVDLGLHCRVDPAMRNDILIAIGATHVRT
jgi:hypothetical protein